MLFTCGGGGIRKDGPGEARAKKCPVDTFLVRGRIPAFPNAVHRTVGGKANYVEKREWSESNAFITHMQKARFGVLFAMISVPCGTGDISSI